MPNYMINSVLNKIPVPFRWAIGIALAGILIFFLWYKGTQLWNGIGNYFFHRQINAANAKVQKDLDLAAEQKKELEKTITELAVAKKELESVKAEKDRLESIFNDQSKTAAQKVAEFKKAVSDDPEHTPTDGITSEDLCARSKAIGASAATIAAVCGH